MSEAHQKTKPPLQRLLQLVRHRRTRTRIWRVAAAILFAIATIVSIARHDAIGTVRTETDAIDARPFGASANVSSTAVRTATHTSPIDSAKLETRLAYVSGRIDTSLFEDGQQAGLSDALILKLVEIFGWDIDFALGIKKGDTFAVLHEENYWMGQKVGDGPILAARFVNRGEMHQAVGFRDDAGVTTYYEMNGQSKRRRFLRTPIEFSRISSLYTTSRFHPILKIWRAHSGVDYAAPTGTPIRATASGRIVPTDASGKIASMESHGGYGKVIVVRHDAVQKNENTYETLYAHLSRYAPNIRVGSLVDQGQIIGYVGKTGLATGPHLHYEFRVNGEHRDPLKVRFPGSASIPVRYRDNFHVQASSLLAQLELITDRHLTASQ